MFLSTNRGRPSRRLLARFAKPIALVLLAVVSNAGAAAPENDAYARQLGELINEYRLQHALQPLALDGPLSELAHEHATHMAREDRLSHDGFQERFGRARSPTCVENVGSNYGTPRAEFDAWRKSSTHDHNLLHKSITRMGVGTDGRYVTFFACQ